MERQQVESDSLASVGFDSDLSVLEIGFRNGTVYQYFAVPRSVFDELMDGRSKGAFFVERIKDVYGFRRVS